MTEQTQTEMLQISSAVLQQLKEKISEQQKTNNDLRQQLSASQLKLTEQNELLEQLQDRKQLQDENKKIQNDYSQLLTKYNTQQSEKEQLQTSLNTANQTIATLKSECSTAKEDATFAVKEALKDDFAALQNAQEQLKNDRAALQNDVEAIAESRTAALKQELNDKAAADERERKEKYIKLSVAVAAPFASTLLYAVFVTLLQAYRSGFLKYGINAGIQTIFNFLIVEPVSLLSGGVLTAAMIIAVVIVGIIGFIVYKINQKTHFVDFMYENYWNKTTAFFAAATLAFVVWCPRILGNYLRSNPQYVFYLWIFAQIMFCAVREYRRQKAAKK